MAPYEILVGGSDEGGGESPVVKMARLLAKQRGPIPVFLKQAPNAWIFNSYCQAKGVVETDKADDLGLQKLLRWAGDLWQLWDQ